MSQNTPNPLIPDDPADAAVRNAPKDRQSKAVIALAGLAAAHTRRMEQTPNRSWLMHYYDDLFYHTWDSSGAIAQLAQSQGRKVVGTFCVFAPDELIYAAGGIPIRLDAGADEAIPEGEQELETVNLCPMIKSSLGMKRLNLPFAGEARVDLALIPSVCDGKKKLVDIFARYVPTWMIQVPHTSLDPRARDFWRTEMRLLRENLEEFTGHKIKPKELAHAIRLFNRKRHAIRRLYEIRKAPNPPITGRDALLVLATSYHDDPLRWVEQTERLCLELEQRVRQGIGVAAPNALRLMLAGCPIVPPNWKVPDILEELGGIIVTDELCTGTRGHWYLVGEDGHSVDEMVTALADRYIMCECPCFVPNTPRLKRIVESAEAWQVKGVIYYQLTFCHTLNLEAVEVGRALSRANIPMFKIDTDYSEQGAEAMRTRLEAFIETLGGRKKQAPKAVGGGIQPMAASQVMWMPLTLPAAIVGELPMVPSSKTPSGPLTKHSQKVVAPQAPPAAPPPAAATLSQRIPARPAAQVPMFHLIAPGGKKISLQEGQSYILGRDLSPSSSTEIDLTAYGGSADLGVSRKHARLVVTASQCTLEDLGSTNGTWLNGRRLGLGEQWPLSGTEEFSLGRFTLRLGRG